MIPKTIQITKYKILSNEYMRGQETGLVFWSFFFIVIALYCRIINRFSLGAMAISINIFLFPTGNGI